VAAAGIKGSCTDNSASVPDVGCCKGCQTHRTGCAKCVAVCCSVLQCVAVCCSVKLIELVVPSVLQCVWHCVAVCCSVLQCVAIFVLAAFPCRMLPMLSTQRTGACCFALQCVAVCCCVLQCVAVRCCVLQCIAVCCLCRMPQRLSNSWNRLCHVCCSVLQCVAVCCSVLQCVAVCYSALQFFVLAAFPCRTVQRLSNSSNRCMLFCVAVRCSVLQCLQCVSCVRCRIDCQTH